jgi:hypothetical protein
LSPLAPLLQSDEHLLVLPPKTLGHRKLDGTGHERDLHAVLGRTTAFLTSSALPLKLISVRPAGQVPLRVPVRTRVLPHCRGCPRCPLDCSQLGGLPPARLRTSRSFRWSAAERPSIHAGGLNISSPARARSFLPSAVSSTTFIRTLRRGSDSLKYHSVPE